MEISVLAVVLSIVTGMVGLIGGGYAFVTRQGERGTNRAEAVRKEADIRTDNVDARLHALELKVAQIPPPPDMSGVRTSINSLDRKFAKLDAHVTGVKESLTKEVESVRREMELRFTSTDLLINGLSGQLETLTRHIMNTEKQAEAPAKPRAARGKS